MSLFAAFKGWFGESAVSFATWLSLDSEVYFPVNNVTIGTSNGTTQIDHIIVSRYGIFVIETKNMDGWIFGGEKQAQWTQSIYGKKFRFQNPLHQNYRHTKALEEFLGLSSSYFHSVVCFVGDSCKFKTEFPSNVICGGPLRYIDSKTEVLLSDDQVANIVEAIQSGMRPKGFLGLTTAETKREHLASLKERHESTTTCPKCSSDLVLRTGKRGERAGKKFYGCSTFPACRYMRDVDPA